MTVYEGYENGVMGPDERHGIWCCLQELILIINVTCIYAKESLMGACCMSLIEGGLKGKLHFCQFHVLLLRIWHVDKKCGS